MTCCPSRPNRFEKLTGERESTMVKLQAAPVYTDAGPEAAQQFRHDILTGLTNPTEDDKRA